MRQNEYLWSKGLNLLISDYNEITIAYQNISVLIIIFLRFFSRKTAMLKWLDRTFTL